MPIEIAPIVAVIAVGTGATLIMDAWNLVLKRAFGIASLDFCLLGRWVRHMPAAFRHTSIRAAPRKAGECAAGWIAHYSIGIALAAAFVAATSGGWLARPVLLPALLYGLATVVLPFLVLQPALGFGIASSRLPAPGRARLKSLTTHTVFGAGLYLSAVGLRWLLA